MFHDKFDYLVFMIACSISAIRVFIFIFRKVEWTDRDHFGNDGWRWHVGRLRRWHLKRTLHCREHESLNFCTPSLRDWQRYFKISWMGTQGGALGPWLGKFSLRTYESRKRLLHNLGRQHICKVGAGLCEKWISNNIGALWRWKRFNSLQKVTWCVHQHGSWFDYKQW